MRNKTWRQRIANVLMVAGLLAALGVAAGSTASAAERHDDGRDFHQVVVRRDDRDRGYDARDGVYRRFDRYHKHNIRRVTRARFHRDGEHWR